MIKFSSLSENDYFTRYDLINYYINLYNYKSYLEIGVNSGECFKRVCCQIKVGVDPEKKFEDLTFETDSDSFFYHNRNTFDIIFIDGLHLKEQATKDVFNALNILNFRGTIVMHDCNPHCEGAQERTRSQNHWNGDVWKAFAFFRQFSFLNMHTVKADNGLGVIKKGYQVPFLLPEELDYKFFLNNLDTLMNLKSVSDSLKLAQENYKLGL